MLCDKCQRDMPEFKSTEPHATVAWRPGDIQTLRPDWTETQAEVWLLRNSSQIQARLIELGWEVIGDLLDYDDKENTA